MIGVAQVEKIVHDVTHVWYFNLLVAVVEGGIAKERTIMWILSYPNRYFGVPWTGDYVDLKKKNQIKFFREPQSDHWKGFQGAG